MGVYQTAKIAKTAPKLLAKWHNRTAPQVTVHRTAPFIYINIFIYLILNIYIYI